MRQLTPHQSGRRTTRSEEPADPPARLPLQLAVRTSKMGWLTRVRHLVVLLAVASLILSACATQENDGQADVTEPSDDVEAEAEDDPAEADEDVTEPVELREVSIVADFNLQPYNAAYFVAQEKGWYEDAGLAVEWFPSQGSTQAASFVATGEMTFGQVAGAALVQAVEGGAPLIAVANLSGSSGACVMVKGDSGITSPQDFAGQTFATAAHSVNRLLMGALLAREGIDPDAVEIVSVPPQNQIPGFLEGQWPLQDSVTYAQYTVLQHEFGEDVNCIQLSDYGVDTIGLNIVTSIETMESEAEMVTAFLDATLRGWRYQFANPEESLEIMRELAPESEVAGLFSDETVIAQLETMSVTAVTPETEGIPYGQASPALWESTVELMHEWAEAELLDPESLYTNALLPNDLTPPGPPW